MTKLPIAIFFICSIFSASSQDLPRIIILATGGTIAGQGTSSTGAGYVPGKLSVEELLNNIPAINKVATVRGEQIASVGSYDITVELWLKLARRINEIFEKDEADGIVITHGTDTQEETAYFLSLTVKHSKPVVLTGAMRPATSISADGPKNLFDAIVAASDLQSRGRGVLISFNEKLFDGKTVVKINTTNVEAFASLNTGPIGKVFDGRVKYYYPAADVRSNSPVFDISRHDSLPRVEIVYMYVGASGTAVRAFANEGAKGIVIAGSGNGSFNKSILREVESGIKKGIAVVRASRVSSGTVTPSNQVFVDEQLGTIAAEDHNPQKARILLMLALTKTSNRNTIQEMFLEY
ncbi:type II asparaginase [Pollutibacter soli]|uniref:type II asparaginase n=1 Tax=Pollutibacter soli TaxID=3034157 RepID=UPI0030139520